MLISVIELRQGYTGEQVLRAIATISVDGFRTSLKKKRGGFAVSNSAHPQENFPLYDLLMEFETPGSGSTQQRISLCPLIPHVHYTHISIGCTPSFAASEQGGTVWKIFSIELLRHLTRKVA
jgi:hypothetical protein